MKHRAQGNGERGQHQPVHHVDGQGPDRHQPVVRGKEGHDCAGVGGACATAGADRAALITAAGLDGLDLTDQDARVPLDRFQSLTLHAKAATGDPAFVLHHEMDTQIAAISVVGLIVHSCRTLGEALSQLNRYGKLTVEVDGMDGQERFGTELTRDGVWIIDNRPDPNGFPELTEGGFGRFIGEFAREFPGRPFALAVEVTHAAPDYAAEYGALWRCPVTFGAPRNAMLIAADWLEQAFDNHIAYVFGVFTDKADTLLAELDRQDGLRARIEAHLLPVLHKGEISVEAVAAEMGMSRQTLYRRLKEEGVTFAALLDDLRCRMASDYLTARKVSVNETAYLVGFSEASSFVRAFRRWTGQTPAEFRSGRAIIP